jgi:predicted short-subunit dehydrogenase-like oxidoreductase (DUF2520 family)
MNLCIIGRGKVGKSLHAGFTASGVSARLMAARSFGKRKVSASTFILAVPDGEIARMALTLAPFVQRGNVVLHCAGARGPEELAACRERGAHVAGFHPLVSFASPEHTVSFRGVTFVVHGEGAASRRARTLAKALGARAVTLPALGALYHASAALVANGSAALVHAGVGILKELGFSQKSAELALSSLLSSVAHNVSLVGVPEALTGPVVRGDADTVARHLAALHERSPALAQSYAAVQPLVLACARDAGLREERARAIERVLTNARKKRR